MVGNGNLVETNGRNVALPTLSTTTWVIHNLGLAVAITGPILSLTKILSKRATQSYRVSAVSHLLP